MLRVRSCRLLAIVPVFAALAACAVAIPRTATAVPAVPEADRAAILAMAGEYAVTFEFHETVILEPGYRRVATKPTVADETVVKVEDAGDRIVLQHLLVADGTAIKHWRQDWTYEAATRFEFTEDQTWRVRPVPESLRRGTWTQCVYEVSDAPRYCGTGRWTHVGGVGTWTSDETWRPLPRREYTTRHDYDALRAINRHTVTAEGWTHEQDNTKVVRDGERVVRELVRESGFNDYRRRTGFDFSPAYREWAATKDYWARVRRAWDRQLTEMHGVRLKTPVSGMPLIDALFDQAERAGERKEVDDAEIDRVFATYVAAP